MKIRFRDRLRYAFDNTMSRGTIALIGWLFFFSLLLILSVSLFVVLIGHDIAEDGRHLGFPEVVWRSMLRTLDPGTMGSDTGDWLFLGSMLFVTLGGIFIVSTLIGIMTSGIERKLETLRKGRSLVAEHGHIVILGWSPHIFSIMRQLVVANQNRPRIAIAILAPVDKIEMEDALSNQVGKTGRVRLVCRTGDILDLEDLEIVNPRGARAIIVLAPPDEMPDAHVIKTILALTHHSKQREHPYHIVAELHDPINLAVAHMVGRSEAQFILAADLIARIIVQTCLQSGLSLIYTELLNFHGDDIYFREEPALVGKTFGEALLAYQDSAVIGLHASTGQVRLNPPMDTRIAQGDSIIAVSRENHTLRLSGLTDYDIVQDAIRKPPPRARAPERTLILGWNQLAPTILNELDNYLPPGSETRVVYHRERALASAEEYAMLQNHQVSFVGGEVTTRRALDELDVPTYQHVVVLSDSEEFTPQAADARTMITLLHLRAIAETCNHSFSIVSEMQDARNRVLAELTQADDFIVSGELVSLMLAQIAQNRELGAVFDELFGPKGSELYLRPMSDYVELERPLNFYTVVEAARRCGQIALGYRRGGATGTTNQSLPVMNPEKSGLFTWSQGDQVIVLAEH